MNKKPPPLLAPSVIQQLQASSLSRLMDALPPVSERYRFRPEEFLEDQLGVRLFDGFSRDWVTDAAIGWLHGHARERYNRVGEDPVEFCQAVRPDLPAWEPGQPVVNTVVLQGGAGLGKSVVVAGLLLWAGYVSRSFTGVVYAPFVPQAYKATWRYVDAYMTGEWTGSKHEQFARLLSCRKGTDQNPSIIAGPLWSVVTKAVNQGTANVQGGHAIVSSDLNQVSASMHVFEEADGIDDPQLFDAVKTMVDKGVSLWFLCLNPATPTAPVQSLHGPKIKRYEVSVLDHPNVVEGRDVVPGASNREWVESKLGDQPSDWACPVPEHDPKRGTFELPWIPGRVWEPRAPWWWRVLGKVPPTGSGDSAVPEALYLSACSRDWRAIERVSDSRYGSIGVDVAQSDAGQGDRGSIAQKWRGVVRVVARPQQKDTRLYGHLVLQQLLEMTSEGELKSGVWVPGDRDCRHIEVRIDNGGGFGRDVYNQIVDHPVWDRFESSRVVLYDFGGKPRDPRRYWDWVTEAYAAVAQTLREYAMAEPPPELRVDLCGRKASIDAKSIGDSRVDVLKLEPKKKFRERVGRSPDDGDSVALACYPRQVSASDWVSFDDRRWGGSSRAGSAPRGKEDDGFSVPPWEQKGDWEDDFSVGGSDLRWKR